MTPAGLVAFGLWTLKGWAWLLAVGVMATSSGGPIFPATWSILETLSGPAA